VISGTGVHCKYEWLIHAARDAAENARQTSDTRPYLSGACRRAEQEIAAVDDDMLPITVR